VLQQARTPFVGELVAKSVMLSAINLDGEPDCRTIKINNVPPERMLSAKTQPVELAVLQRVPKFSFRLCRIAA
jgi:hypothetical protein